MKSKESPVPCKDLTHVLKHSHKYGFTEEDLAAKRNGTCAKRKHTECFKREYLAPKVIRNSLSYIIWHISSGIKHSYSVNNIELRVWACWKPVYPKYYPIVKRQHRNEVIGNGKIFTVIWKYKTVAQDFVETLIRKFQFGKLNMDVIIKKKTFAKKMQKNKLER